MASGTREAKQQTTDNGQRTTGVPDAIMLPEDRKRGARMIERVASIADIAEPTLAVNHAAGERAYIRLQGNGKLFISKSIVDTILFPKGHPRRASRDIAGSFSPTVQRARLLSAGIVVFSWYRYRVAGASFAHRPKGSNDAE